MTKRAFPPPGPYRFFGMVIREHLHFDWLLFHERQFPLLPGHPLGARGGAPEASEVGRGLPRSMARDFAR